MNSFAWTSSPRPCTCGHALPGQVLPRPSQPKPQLPQSRRHAQQSDHLRHHPQRLRQRPRCQAASEVAEAPRQAAAQGPRPPKVVSRPGDFNFEVLEKLRTSGETQQGTIVEANRGGFVVELAAGPKGFTPFSKVDPSRLRDKHNQVRNIDSIDEGAGEDPSITSQGEGQPQRPKLQGQPISVKVVQVDDAQKTAILSEIEVQKEEFMASVQPGDVVNGQVHKLTDFGAFVYLQSLDGQMHGVEGLVHITELSWQKVTMPEKVVALNEAVRCQILSMDPRKGRINLSIKRLQDDPLQRTIETVMPLDQLNEDDKVLHVPSFVPATVDKVCGIISRQPGIDALRLGRQVEERGAVSQDLELYISKDHQEDGFTLIARSEGRVQEILLTTSLDTKELRQLVQNVLKRLV